MNRKKLSNNGWDYGQKNSSLGKYQNAAGKVRHPITGKWQVWLSLYGVDVTCVSVHEKEQDADFRVEAFCEAWQSGQLLTTDQVQVFIKNLSSDSVPDPLPQYLLEEIVLLMRVRDKKKMKNLSRQLSQRHLTARANHPV